MGNAILATRPWDWYVRQALEGIGWNAGARLAYLGETADSQAFLRRAWNIAFYILGRDDLIDKYATLPLKGEIPPGATSEDREFFRRFAHGSKSGGLKRYSAPVYFNGALFPFDIYVVSGKRGYKQVQDQFVWVKEYRGGIVSEDFEAKMRKLNQTAIDTKVDFIDVFTREIIDPEVKAAKE